jgi:predicted AlkP superfamily pyrophosphatase or phosphodiesterase
VHFAGVDGAQHAQGRDGDMVKLALATADRAINHIMETVINAKLLDSTTIIITGDHGFMTINTAVKPNVWLKRAGLLGEGKNWKVKFQPAGGSAFLYLQDKKDQQTFNKVKDLLAKLPAGTQKLFAVYDRKKLDEMGADSSAVLALSAIPGIVFSGSANGEDKGAFKGGHHGYDPNYPEMFTGFIGIGAGLAKSVEIEQAGVEDTAPLIAFLLGIPFSAPDGTLYPGMFGKH